MDKDELVKRMKEEIGNLNQEIEDGKNLAS